MEREVREQFFLVILLSLEIFIHPEVVDYGFLFSGYWVIRLTFWAQVTVCSRDVKAVWP